MTISSDYGPGQYPQHAGSRPFPYKVFCSNELVTIEVDRIAGSRAAAQPAAPAGKQFYRIAVTSD
jgi:hypothetical protein